MEEKKTRQEEIMHDPQDKVSEMDKAKSDTSLYLDAKPAFWLRGCPITHNTLSLLKKIQMCLKTWKAYKNTYIYVTNIGNLNGTPPFLWNVV